MIGKKTREQAAVVCAIYASTTRWLPLEDLGSVMAIHLVNMAMSQAQINMPFCYGLALYAEAESLLRCGWSPK